MWDKITYIFQNFNGATADVLEWMSNFTAHFTGYIYTVRCCYNAVNFLLNSHNRHPIAHPWGRGMGCLLWVWSLIYILLLSSQYHIWDRDKFDRVITGLDCIFLSTLEFKLNILVNGVCWSKLICKMDPYTGGKWLTNVLNLAEFLRNIERQHHQILATHGKAVWDLRA